MYKLITFLGPYAKYFLAAWIIAIITVSSIPSIPTLKIHTHHADIRLDYLFHFLEYGFLAVLAYLSFAEKDFRISFLKYLILTVCLAVFALADESHQIIIPGRSFNPRDILSNLAGIAAGLLFCVVVFRGISVKPQA
jgi:VanZ family protein